MKKESWLKLWASALLPDEIGGVAEGTTDSLQAELIEEG